MSDKIFSAIRFAADAHSGQYRKGTKLPYLVHPIAVMQYLIQYNASDDAVAAGILHDTLEDTPTSADDLRTVFGNRITDLVIGASEPDKRLSWMERKKVGAEFMTLVSAGRLVKGCICALYCYTAKDFLNIAAKAK